MKRRGSVLFGPDRIKRTQSTLPMALVPARRGAPWAGLLGMVPAVAAAAAAAASGRRSYGGRSTAPLRRSLGIGGNHSYQRPYGRGVSHKGFRSGTARRAVGREVPFYLPRSMARVEAHTLDTDLNVELNSAGTTTHVNPVSRGDASFQRLGDRLQMASIHIRGEINQGPITTAPQFSSTLALVYDRRPTGALPAITDVFDSINVNTFQRLSNRNRFLILWRHRITMTDSGPGAAQPVDLRIPLNLVEAYTAGQSSELIAGVVSGALYFIGIGSAGGVNVMDANLRFRLVFAP